MEITKPNNHNFTYLGDASLDIADLPVRVGEDPVLGRTITSAWKPTEAERLVLLNGGSVALTVMGHGHPPVMVSVESVHADLFTEEPLNGVIGWGQQWEGGGVITHTFDAVKEQAEGRYAPDGWRKVGEVFPIARAIGWKA